MKKSALIVTIINGFVIGIQIIGQIVVARLFGAKIELDGFVAAVTIPTMLVSVIAATLSDAFLPILKQRQLNNEDESHTYFFKMAFLVSLILLIVTIGIDIFSFPLLASLFGVRGEVFVLFTDRLMRYMLYTLPFSVLNTLFNSYLYSKKRFFLPSISTFCGSILNLSIIILLSPSIGITSMVIAFIAAIVLQIVIVFPYQIRSYALHVFSSLCDRKTKSEIITLFLSWSPLLASALILRFDAVLTRSFSARLPEGYIVYVNLVVKLFAGLIGITTIGIQTVFFTHLVELVHTHNYKKAQVQVNKAKLYGFLLSVGTILVILVIAPFFMRLFLTGGKFTGKNVEILISLFPYFIIPAIGWGISQIFAQPIIAIGKQYLLTLVNILAVCLAWIAAALAYNTHDGMMAISIGLIVLSFTGIIGAEIIWRIQLKKLLLSLK